MYSPFYPLSLGRHELTYSFFQPWLNGQRLICLMSTSSTLFIHESESLRNSSNGSRPLCIHSINFGSRVRCCPAHELCSSGRFVVPIFSAKNRPLAGKCRVSVFPVVSALCRRRRAKTTAGTAYRGNKCCPRHGFRHQLHAYYALDLIG